MFARNFAGYDYIVGPSASCIHHVREHLTAIEQTDEVKKVRASAYELVEFLHDVVGAREFPWAEFPHRVGLHNSCSALRHLKEASISEVAGTPFSKPRTLLERRQGHRVRQARAARRMLRFRRHLLGDRRAGVGAHGAGQGPRPPATQAREYIVSGDMSCLMHQQGCAERMKAEARFIHIAQVLNGARA